MHGLYNVRKHGDMFVFELEDKMFVDHNEDAAFVYDKIQEWYEKHAPEHSVLRNNRCYWDQHPTELAKNAYIHAVREFRKRVEEQLRGE